ncbi:MAG: triose-phosphate isomerase [Corticimicrobacter sp.]|uniref:triose-phosphate isomerase n=1 Tax=Corticimicrobacter sp. TaxID=2678536 RepID=UPI0032DB9240
MCAQIGPDLSIHRVNTTAMRRLVIGNWKMNGSLAENARLLSALLEQSGRVSGAELAVCVPYPYLAQVAQALDGHDAAIAWGAQDVSVHVRGAFTGEVSADMLHDFGVCWVLVGHSERRAYHGESDELVALKAEVALAAGLMPVVCVGETLQQHQDGLAHEVITRQLAPVLALGAERLARLVVAYEPVWAIGTGQTATPEQAQEVHAFIRATLAAAGAAQVRLLYGGSVKPDNAAGLFAMEDIDGALVGGASLDADEFIAIAAA